jgi:RNA-binding protein
MAITPQQRRALMVEGHHLKPVATVAAGEVSDGAVAHVRAAFVGRELVKLRVNADSGAECDGLGAELARRVPCEMVRRLGRVLLLYRAAEPAISQDDLEAE